MTLKQIRDALRRQIRDVPKVEWPDDGELDNLIVNPAYFLVQKEIFKLYPNAHLFWDYADLTSGMNWYPLPATFHLKEISVKATAADTEYTALEKKDYQDIKNIQSSSGEQYYCLEGQWIGIFPAPGENITNGLEIRHAAIQALSTDTDVPRIKLPLHMAIVWWAKLIALGDTDEKADETRSRLNEAMGDLALWYESNANTPDQLQVVR